MGLWSVALVSLPLLAVLIFTRPILLFFQQEPRLAADAAIFMSGLAWGLPFAMAFQVLRSFSTALSRAVPPLVVMGSPSLWNAGFDYALIFGHFGLPRLGLYGAGLASASSNIFSFAGHAGDLPVDAGAEALSHPASLVAAALGIFRRVVPAGPSHRHHHGVRGGAVQRRRAGDGHLRPGLAGGASDRHHHSLPHLHGPAGHRPGRDRAGGTGGGRRRPDRGAARRLHRHRHGRVLHVRHRAGVAALAARDRQPVAARYAGQSRKCWRWRSASCMSPPPSS